jgi:hypothetical protein
VDLFYKRAQVTDALSFGVDAGLFAFERKNIVKYGGKRYGARLYYDNFSLRLGMNDFDDFSEIVPTLIYENSYRKNNYTLEYTRQNALFYTYSEIPYEKKIKADHFSLTDNISFENSNTLWANINVNFFSNQDREITAQFDYLFYKDTLFSPKFSYGVAVEGWYTAHSKQHQDFYSPKFSDATLLRVDPKYIFSKYFGLRGKIGGGVSVSDENTPYKYGLWGFGEIVKGMDYAVGCLKSNAARLANGPTYHYTECEAHLGYTW